MVSDRDRFFFDLNGYVVRPGALSTQEVDQLNAVIDAMPRIKPGEWLGYIKGHGYSTNDGFNYQQIYEAGEPFEKLIDHPSYIEHVKQFVGGQDGFDATHGPLFLDENFVNLRGPGNAIPLHSGGHEGCKRTQFRVHRGKFMCGQINVLIALTDIGPGDGATMIVPCSHKVELEHPALATHSWGDGRSADNVEGAVELHMKAGDAIVFVDALMHGSAKRIADGERRIIVYRFGPSWGFFHHPVRPSPELLARLTPERKKIVWPHEPEPREPQYRG